eukprot:14038271-Alexandrium_andersonii.AAC.1
MRAARMLGTDAARAHMLGDPAIVAKPIVPRTRLLRSMFRVALPSRKTIAVRPVPRASPSGPTPHTWEIRN